MRQGAGEMPLWHILPESRQVVRTCIPPKTPAAPGVECGSWLPIAGILRAESIRLGSQKSRYSQKTISAFSFVSIFHPKSL